MRGFATRLRLEDRVFECASLSESLMTLQDEYFASILDQNRRSQVPYLVTLIRHFHVPCPNARYDIAFRLVLHSSRYLSALLIWPSQIDIMVYHVRSSTGSSYGRTSNHLRSRMAALGIGRRDTDNSMRGRRRCRKWYDGVPDCIMTSRRM